MIKNVVIVGGGFNGWYVAATLCHNLPDLAITIIDSDKHPRLGVGETLGFSSPYDWKRNLGLKDDRLLMWETGAIYKYGASFSDFLHDHSILAYGKFVNLKVQSLVKFYGEFDYPDFFESWSKQPGDVGVQQAWLTINQFTNKTWQDYVDEINEGEFFSSNAVAPYNNRNQYVLRPAEGWSYHIDAEATVRFLKHLAQGHTVTHISSAVIGADLDNQGGIGGLKLENNQTLTADLFIDASGFARVLMKHAPNQSWHHAQGASNSAWVVPSRYTDPAKQMIGGTQFYGEDHGWRFQVGLYHRIGNGYVFDSDLTDPEIPRQRLLEITHGTRFVDPRLLQWTPGYYQTPWINNVLPLGVASGFVDPFDAPTFDILSRDLVDLVRVLQGQDYGSARTDFNQQHSLVQKERTLRLTFDLGLSHRRGQYWEHRRAAAAEKMSEFYAVLNSQSNEIDQRITHFWNGMYFRMAMATGVDRSRFCAVPLSDSDRAMAESFFAYNRARNHYIRQQQWPNYYEWLRVNRFNGLTSNEVLAKMHPQWA